MKTRSRIFAVLLLVCLLLTACDLSALTEKEFKKEDISITLPITFIDYSTNSSAEGKHFLFASPEIGLTGVKEDKREFYDAFGSIDLEGYSNLIAELYELNVTASKKDDCWTFTYQKDSDGVSYTYCCQFRETGDAFWNLQAYCKTADYEKNADTLWKYVTSIVIADSGIVVPEPTEPPTTQPPTTQPPTTQPPTEPPIQTYIHGSCSIDLPTGFVDYSDTELGEDFAFLYADDTTGVLCIQENKKELYQYFSEMDLESYANLIAELYALDVKAIQRDGFWTIAYKDDSSGVSYTYLCVFYETAGDFWDVRAYCPTSEYQSREAELWKYATSLKFADN